MKQFCMLKSSLGYYHFASHLYKSDLFLLVLLVEEIWGHGWKVNYLQTFLSQKKLEDDYDCTGFNNGLRIEDNVDGFIVISYEWSEGNEFRFPKEKFKEFIRVVDEKARQVLSLSIYNSPDQLKFTIDDNWNTRIRYIYLKTDKCSFEKNGTGRPQFRLEKIKGYDYQEVENDCIGDVSSKLLAIFLGDIWLETDIFEKNINFINDKGDRTIKYKKTFLEKKGDVFTIGLLGEDSNSNKNIKLCFEKIHSFLSSNELFFRRLGRVLPDRLPGMIFYTVDEFWNVIAISLFRPEDKNFVEKE